MASFKGKGLESTLDIYRVLKDSAEPLNACRIWKRLPRPGRPHRTGVMRKVRRLHKRGYLVLDHTEIRPGGQFVRYYRLSPLFDLAIAEIGCPNNSVVIPRDLVEGAKEFLKSDRAKAMGLFTVCDVVNAAARALLQDNDVHVQGARVIRDRVDRVLERSDRR